MRTALLLTALICPAIYGQTDVKPTREKAAIKWLTQWGALFSKELEVTPPKKIELKDMQKIRGSYFPDSQTIALNRKRYHELPARTVLATLFHETVHHALQQRGIQETDAHGPEFRKLARKWGIYHTERGAIERVDKGRLTRLIESRTKRSTRTPKICTEAELERRFQAVVAEYDPPNRDASKEIDAIEQEIVEINRKIRALEARKRKLVARGVQIAKTVMKETTK